MLIAITALLVFQLIGETVASGLALTIPGPVIGFVLLAWRSPSRGRSARRSSRRRWSCCVTSRCSSSPPRSASSKQLPLLEAEWLAIGTALIVSTVASLAVTALTFRAVARLLGLEEER